jgi:lysophospholipase L1-like esterase
MAAIVAALVVSMLGSIGPVAAATAASTGEPWALALGDSVAAGFQPGRGDTAHGYPTLLRRMLRARVDGLQLRNVACDGESTRSMITGNGSACTYASGSQLDAALAFLGAHAGEVAYVTIDVGVNDLLRRCPLHPRTALIDRDCVTDLMPHVQARIGTIVDALVTAAPGVPIVGMTYYDPFLGFWVLGPQGHAVARANLRAWLLMNDALVDAYTGAGASVADVAATFRIEDFTRGPQAHQPPVNVAITCEWTWFCSQRFFFDPHPNRIGHRKIARTFTRVIRGLLP